MQSSERSNEDISRSWIRHYARMGRPISDADIEVHDDDPDWWAVELLMKLDDRDPVRALDIAFLVAKGSDDDWVLENLGAGPLEDLIEADPTFLDPIALEASSNVRLREALRSVWQREMSDETWARLQSIARS